MPNSLVELYLEKIAKSRWKKEREKELALAGVSRFTGRDAGTGYPMDAGAKEIQKNFQEYASPLTGEHVPFVDLNTKITRKPLSSAEAQLARRRKLDEKLVDHYMRHGNAVPHSLPKLGPVNVAGTVFMNPRTVGEFLRKRKINVPPEAEASVARAILQHERAEGVQLGNVITGETPSAAHASHAGALPMLAERMYSDDPAVHAVIDKMRREGNREDRAAQKILRQRGQVGSHVLPMGGKAHRSAEAEIIKKIKPQLMPGLEMQRQIGAQGSIDPKAFLAHTSSIPSGTPMERLSVKTKGLINTPRLIGAGLAASVLGPMVYGAYRRRQAENQLDPQGAGELKTASGAYDVPLVYGGAALMHATVDAAKRHAYREEGLDPDKARWRAPAALAGAAGAAGTYGLLSYKYPKMTRPAKGLMAGLAALTAAPLARIGFEEEMIGHNNRRAADALQAAKEQGANFDDYLHVAKSPGNKFLTDGYTADYYNTLIRREAEGKKDEDHFLDRYHRSSLEDLAARRQKLRDE